MTRARLTDVMDWLAVLGRGDHTFEGKSLKETTGILRPMAASLLKSYDAADFGQDSREYVGAGLKWFREADIRERLDTWVKMTAAPVRVLPAKAEAAPISPNARRWYGRFLEAPDTAAAVRTLTTMRAVEPDGWDWIVRHDDDAAGYAVTNHWTPTPTRDELAADWDDERAIRTKARDIMALSRETPFAEAIKIIMLNMLVATVRFHAPQHGIALADELRAIRSGVPPTIDVVPVPAAFPDDALNLFFGE